VIPNNPPLTVTAVREDLRQALQRAAILSNEKYRGIRFAVKPNALVIQSHNPEQEEAEEELEVAYAGQELEIGFNVNYLLDALAAIDAADVEVGLTDGNSSCLIRSSVDVGSRFVVMPMRL
jgi:DNA polymerase-3 subunit beta